MSELVWGIKNGDLDQVKDIVEQKVSIWWCSFSGPSIVWNLNDGRLCYECQFILFKLLQEIDVNKEIDGRPPLHYAADYGQGDVIQYLLSKGANVNVRNKTS
jgi:ankyrin repeat protein